LGAPNIGCPGCNGSSMAWPETGFGGDPYLRSNSAPHDFLLDSKGDKQLNPSANCKPLGKILVIQEANTPCPDDNSEGGWIEFDFWFPTEVKLEQKYPHNYSHSWQLRNNVYPDPEDRQ
jgi:hypothetical protein